MRGIGPGSSIVNTAKRGVREALVAMGFLPPEMDGGGCILHVSDTPSSTYGYLVRAVRSMGPSVLVHTGDVADEVKLGLWPQLIDEYRRKVGKLARLLDGCGCRLIVTCGNHDDPEVLKEALPWGEIYPRWANLDARGRSISAAHRFKDLERLGDVNLFGHDLEVTTSTEGDRLILNGIERMNLVDPAAMRVRFVRYPPGTDDERTLKRRRGL
ncbi:metallophosphoesterase [Thermanaerovibrio acidaminovorans]|uniref:Calcineurin-like phosphoesterase domain-containing protein n=1 Tax=Thermanaerovibrio acidaminovorans (strain ATCC 49978 / DSM 6589 / Su883) TaxID=525903 RepID=D1B8G2_THEAS|nr:metallophosphoesterase [Thermanaerovibrio acidaminovorans]ACZ18565.1 hypothetical protein Taci_0328 [Thermanaerovibrio acidaminovorans DSM 6589]